MARVSTIPATADIAQNVVIIVSVVPAIMIPVRSGMLSAVIAEFAAGLDLVHSTVA